MASSPKASLSIAKVSYSFPQCETKFHEHTVPSKKSFSRRQKIATEYWHSIKQKFAEKTTYYFHEIYLSAHQWWILCIAAHAKSIRWLSCFMQSVRELFNHTLYSWYILCYHFCCKSDRNFTHLKLYIALITQ